MNLIRLAAIATLVFTLAAKANATTYKSTTVTLDNQAKVYAEIHRGLPGKATFVLLNGLVYDMQRWNRLSDALADQGFTIVRYAYEAQPESLMLAPNETPPFLVRGLELKDLSNELTSVLNKFQVKDKIQLVGLSYGSTVATEFAATHPQQIASLILMSPLIVPLDSYEPQGQGLRVWLNSVRFWEDSPCQMYGAINPWLCMARDYWYDSFYNYFYENYLGERVQKSPEGIDPAIYKKAVFHLVRATRDFDLRSYSGHLPNVHFLIASEDEANMVRDQKDSWSRIPQAQQRSFITFEGAHHALPDEAPLRTAEVLTAIANAQQGRVSTVQADR